MYSFDVFSMGQVLDIESDDIISSSSSSNEESKVSLEKIEEEGSSEEFEDIQKSPMIPITGLFTPKVSSGSKKQESTTTVDRFGMKAADILAKEEQNKKDLINKRKNKRQMSQDRKLLKSMSNQAMMIKTHKEEGDSSASPDRCEWKKKPFYETMQVKSPTGRNQLLEKKKSVESLETMEPKKTGGFEEHVDSIGTRRGGGQEELLEQIMLSIDTLKVQHQKQQEKQEKNIELLSERILEMKTEMRQI